MKPHPTNAHQIPHEDLRILALGPLLKTGITPTVVYFSLSAEDSLLVDPYNQPTRELLKNESTRVISITLPFHGNLPPEEALRMWVKELEEGRDVLTPFIEKTVDFLDMLKKDKIISEDQLAFMGLSRGGWVACQVGARTKAKAIVGYAPMTKFSKSVHFTHLEKITKPFDLEMIAENLVGTAVHFWISNRDMRVGTRQAFDFIETLSIKSQEKEIRSPQVFMTVVPPIGAQGHGTSNQSFIEGAEWALQQIQP